MGNLVKNCSSALSGETKKEKNKFNTIIKRIIYSNKISFNS